MLNTNNLQSGFDVELHLGRGWLHTALDIIVGERAAGFPIVPSVVNVRILDSPVWDIVVNIFPLGFVNATIALNAAGTSLDIVTDNPLFPTFNVALPPFGSLAGPPVLQKVIGDADHENALVLLANVNLRASPQNVEPLPAGEHLARGVVADTRPYLPNGQDLALGISAATFQRFANHIWHDTLRNDDGRHLILDDGDRVGVWQRVDVDLNNDRVRFQVRGEADIDNGFLDFFVDADINFSLELRPELSDDGKLRFVTDTDLNIDTGIMGDFLAFMTGGLLAFPLMALTGGLLNPATLSIGAVVALEVAERVVGDIVEREVLGESADSDAVRPAYQSCDEGVVKITLPALPESTVNVGPLDAIPSDITLITDRSADLFTRFLSVNAIFDELSMTGNGLGVAGSTEAAERLVPHPVEISEVHYDEDDLLGFTYRRLGTTTLRYLTVAMMETRIAEGAIDLPLAPGQAYTDGRWAMPEGRLASLCLTPLRIRRADTVITHFQFAGDHVLAVADCVRLQNAGVIVLPGLQLIEPTDGDRPYFRSRPDADPDNNLESLPEF